MKIGIVGLGYVGLSTACLFSKKYEVVGYDLSKRRVDEINAGHDSNMMLSARELREAAARGMVVTGDSEKLRGCNVYIVVVPTPIDAGNRPDTSCLESASEVVGRYISKGDIVVYESTVYPGATEEVCVPIIEKVSGLTYNTDFFAGYSPERVNPGDSAHRVEDIRKITSGSTPEVAKVIDGLYNSVLNNGTHMASSIKVAEAAKVMENTQRDISIAFMNEMAIILHKLGIDTQEVIDAASTKWNFQRFSPGLVGGHCIGVDPYYLISKAEAAGVKAGLISEARRVNEHMGVYVADQVVDLMEKKNIDVKVAHVLLMGFTFKENCPDTRNTKVLTVYNTIREKVACVEIFDPWVDKDEVKQRFHVDVQGDVGSLVPCGYDAIILCVKHDVFNDINLATLTKPTSVIYDVKGMKSVSN